MTAEQELYQLKQDLARKDQVNNGCLPLVIMVVCIAIYLVHINNG